MVNFIDQIITAIVLIAMVIGAGIGVALFFVIVYHLFHDPYDPSAHDDQPQTPPPPWDDFWRH